MRGFRETRRVGLELGRQKAEEGEPILRVELRVPVQKLARDGDARGLSAPGNEHARELLHVGLGAGAKERPRQQRAALVGNRAQHLLQERNVHVQCPFHLGRRLPPVPSTGR